MTAPYPVSDTFDPAAWREVTGFALTDVTYHRGIDPETGADLPWVRIGIDRQPLRNAFRPLTVDELYRCLDDVRQRGDVGCVILTGNNPDPSLGWGFCSGGDQRIRGQDGYRYEVEDKVEGEGAAAGDNAANSGPEGGPAAAPDSRGRAIDPARAGRLHILEVQRLIRQMPKVVIAAVSGWAAGGGHSLNVVCDLSLASAEHARFMQTDANVGSFDAGYGSALLARQVGDKRAREIFFLARAYDAAQAQAWGVVNEAVPHAALEKTAIEWARIVTSKSPTAIRMLKFAFNLADDGLAGQQVFAGEATRLAYGTDEAAEGRDAFVEHRRPDWSPFPYAF